jgi:hypothetical protein
MNEGNVNSERGEHDEQPNYVDAFWQHYLENLYKEEHPNDKTHYCQLSYIRLINMRADLSRILSNLENA